MNTPNQHSEAPITKHSTQEIMLFENRIESLMFTTASKLTGKVKSFQLMRDDNFVHRRDRTTNDIHIFFELNNGQFFHLRAYTRYMLDMEEIPTDKIFLTGYKKPSVSQTGGEHAFKQDWYPWDPEAIANEVLSQMKNSPQNFQTTAKELQQELAMRGQYYFKDFGMILSDILVNLEIFAIAEPTQQIADQIRHRLGQISDAYQTIPFNQIPNHPDLDLFTTIRDAITKLHQDVEKILNGEQDISEAEATIGVILDKGTEYRMRLIAILEKLNSQPGHEHDRLASTSICDGKVWDSALF